MPQRLEAYASPHRHKNASTYTFVFENIGFYRENVVGDMHQREKLFGKMSLKESMRGWCLCK